MATATFVVESSLSPEVAFDQMVDLTRVPEWDPGIRGSRLISGEAGSVGTRYDVDITGFDGKPTSAVYELTSVDDNRAFTMVGTHPDFRAEDSVSFESTDGGCRITYVAGLELLGEHPPISETQLAATFPSLVAVAEAGITSFLKP